MSKAPFHNGTVFSLKHIYKTLLFSMYQMPAPFHFDLFQQEQSENEGFPVASLPANWPQVEQSHSGDFP